MKIPESVTFRRMLSKLSETLTSTEQSIENFDLDEEMAHAAIIVMGLYELGLIHYSTMKIVIASMPSSHEVVKRAIEIASGREGSTG